MTKYILIGGQIHKADDGGKAFCEELIKNATNKPIKILDCLFGRAKEEWKEKFENDTDFFSKNLESFELALASPEKFIDQMKNSDVIFFQGGIPGMFMSILNTIPNWQNELEGKVLVGSSGGADTIVKYYGVGKTMNIGNGLGLLPIKFIPHWKSDYAKGLNIDWDMLLEELKFYKEKLETIVLKEGEFLVLNQ